MATRKQLPEEILDNRPEGFPCFEIGNQKQVSWWLSRYLWYHFANRPGHLNTLFPLEYLTLADLWMGEAKHPGWKKDIQQLFRQSLLSIRLDDEGYVWTHQHFSHAHEHGWPFPMWTQGVLPDGQHAVGWHFQESDGPGWVWEYFLDHQPDSPFGGEKATRNWGMHNLYSNGIMHNCWKLEVTGPDPTLTTPPTGEFDADNAPFLQLRWNYSETYDIVPYVEWRRSQDRDFSPERRVYFPAPNGNPDYEKITSHHHTMIPMSQHPLWNGRIKQLRIHFGEDVMEGEITIDSLFTVYDTRHTINNPNYILGCWNYFRWTGDIRFLQMVINRMRVALRYQMTVLGGSEHELIRNPWVGHDGRSGIVFDDKGEKHIRSGAGIGNNYWDLMPFGGDDMYSTSQYYASLKVMAQVEELAQNHPEWNIPGGVMALDPKDLRAHAEKVKQKANKVFWDKKAGRYIACIDRDGQPHDYGYTFLNLEAIWYGIATPKHAQSIYDWLEGRRIVEGDTSTGDDIYHWRFGPRSTTRRNLDWYGFMWHSPEDIPWGGQVQDGGAVLGFTFFDLIGRLRVLGATNAWERLEEIMNWESEVWSEGGYRSYYADGKRGTTLQGGGTAGGLGIDCEFFESSLLPAAVVYGFLGLEPDGEKLNACPQLPDGITKLTLKNLLYHGWTLDITATSTGLRVQPQSAGPEPIVVALQQPDSPRKVKTVTISSLKKQQLSY